MFRKGCKSILALAIACLLTFSVGVAAFAADASTIDLNKKGSVTVTLRKPSGSHAPIPGGTFTLYHVADLIEQKNGLIYRYTSDFADCGADLDRLNQKGLAEHLAGYAEKEKLDGETKTAGKDGSVMFRNLSLGLYLVVQEGTVSGYYSIDPFVVSVPMENEKGSGWIYDVDASPKAEPKPDKPGKPDDDTKVTVKKVWHGKDNDRPDSITVHLLRDGKIYKTVVLSDKNDWKYVWNHLDDDYRWSVVEADVPDGYEVEYSKTGTTITIINEKKPERPDIPDNPEDLTVEKVWSGDGNRKRPEEITIALWNGNKLYDSVVLSGKNGWSYHWSDLPKSGDWEIEEINVPEGYEESYQVVGDKIIVKNTFTPDTPDTPDTPKTPGTPESPTPPNPGEPPLIQTGQLNWPIPVLAGAGILLFAIGWFLVFVRGNRHDSK